MDQRTEPNDFSHAGIMWGILGVMEMPSSDTLTVELSDTGAYGLVVADAILVSRQSEND